MKGTYKLKEKKSEKKEKKTRIKSIKLDKDIFKDKFKSIGIIFLISFIFIYIWINRSNLWVDNVTIWLWDKASSMGRGEGFPCKILGEKVSQGNFVLVDGDILELSDTDFVCLNSSGKQISSKKHSFSNPIMKANGCRSIIFDSGGRDFSIKTKSRELYSGEGVNNILCAGISKNGVYGIVSKSSDYLSEMSIYDKQNNEVYKYFFAGCYVTDIALSDNGKYASVCGISSNEGEMMSVVYVFDFKNESPRAQFEFEKTIMFSIEYFSNGNIAVIGDRMSSIIYSRFDGKQDILYENKILKCFDINRDVGIAYGLSYGAGGQECNLMAVDSAGKVCSDIQVGKSIESISYRDGLLALLSGDKIITYDLGGNIRGKWDSGSSPKKIILNSSSVAYVLKACEVQKLYLR